MSTNINSTEQIVEINAGDQITNVNIVSQSTTQVISGEQVVTVDVNAGTIPAAWGSITGTLSNQTDLQNALNAKQNNITLTTTGTSGAATLIGATLNIPNYTDTGLTSVGLAMPEAFTVSGSPLTSNGTITVLAAGTGAQYIKGDGSLGTFPTTIDQSLRLIREVYNNTGATLTKGTIVYINGGQGNLPTVTKALATGDATSAQTFGVVQANITNQNNGYVVVAGGIDNLDTQAFSVGAALYLSPTVAGQWTTTKPYAPDHLVYIGTVVRSHPTQGVVEVRIANGYELDEIHNVSARYPNNNDGLFYNSTSGVWENKTVSGALGYTPVPQSRIITINGTAQDLSADRTYNVGTVTQVAASGGTGISVAGSPVTGSGTITITNTAPDQVVGLTGAGTTSISGTYPNFTITSNDQYTGTVTSVAASGGTGISISGSPVTGSGTINITNTAPDQIVSLTGAGTTSISGTYPNFTVTSNDQYVGTVTSVNATVPTGFEVSGVPITSSGTVDIKFASGYSLPTNAKQTQWDDAYAKRIDILTVTGNSGSATLTSNVLNVPTYTLTGLGGEPAITAGTTSQYWRGDKSFQTLDTSVVPENGNVYFTEPRVRATVLSGLNITGGSISASDSILNAFGKVQNQINGLIGGSIFQSTWNASTNTPTLASGVGTKGYYYIVSVAGTTNLDGITDWQIGDWAIFDGIVWRKVDNTDAVVSVNGYTGVVSLVLDDLADVSAASPTDTQLLRYNGTTSKWYNWTPTFEPALTKGNLTEATSSVLTITGGSNAVIGSGTTIEVKSASASQNGVVTTGAQTFAGDKTFNGTISASNLSGTNTGDQTITLTGDVTGSGTGSFSTTVNAYFDQRVYNRADNYLGGYYVDGTQKPNNAIFGYGKLKLAMLSDTNLGFGGSWNDVLWISSYNGGDVKSSHALVFDKYSSDVWVSDQNFDATSWGTGYKIWHSGNLTPQTQLNGTGFVKATGTTISYDNTSYLPLTGGTLSNDLTISGALKRLIITDATNSLNIGLWDNTNIRLEGAGRPMYMVSYGGTISIGRNAGTNLVVDTSTLTYGNANITAAGNINGVGLNISGISELTNTVKHTGYDYRIYENLCATDNYISSGGGTTGAFAINTQIPWNAGNMLTIEVKGYDYNGSRNFTATFSCYAGENNFYATGYTTNADDVFSGTYRFFRNASDKIVLVLGATNIKYPYQLWVSEFKQGFSDKNASYANGWTITQIANTTGLSNETTILNKTYTGGTFNGGTVTGTSIIKSGGTSSQFLKADGSVDSNTYALNSALSNYLPLSGGTLTGSLSGTSATFSGGVTSNATSSVSFYSGTYVSNTLGDGSFATYSSRIRENGSYGINIDLYDRTAATWRTPLSFNNTGGAATFSSSVTATQGKFSGSRPQGIFTENGTSGLYLRDATGSSYKSWSIGTNDIVVGFAITPSTAAGGTTFTTPAFVINESGAATFSSSLTTGGQITASYSGARLSLTDGTNAMTIGLWDGSNCRIEGGGRPMYMVSYGGTISIGRSGGTNLVVDSSTTSYGSSSFTSAGQFTGVNLDISTNSLLNRVKYTQSGYRVYRNLARFDNYNNGAGAIAVYTNIPWNAANMLTIQLKGFRYGDRPFDITVACYAGEGNFYSPGYFTNSANAIFGTYTWYKDANNKVVLVLGTTGGTYGVQIWAAEYKQGFGGQDPTYADGWSIAKITSTTGLSNGVNIPEKTYTGGIFNGETVTTTGTGVFGSSVTATSFFESSDIRLKSNIQDYKSSDILNISAKIYEKDGKIEVGYLAQDLQNVLGSAISVRDNGYLDLSYRQVHTAKIAALEAKIKELEAKLK